MRVEDQRSSRSGAFYVDDDEMRARPRGRATPITKTAILSVGMLVLVVGWLVTSHSGTQYVRSSEPQAQVATADSVEDGLAAIAASANMEVTASDLKMIGPSVVGALVSQYQALKDSGSYSPEAAAGAAQQLGENAYAPVPYKQYTQKDILETPDNSYASMLRYRSALKDALTPMASLKDFELGIFAKYSETKDPAYLEELRSAIANYTTSTNAAASLSVPSDAALLHANVLSAMGQFAGVLEGLADNANDPITVMVLLRTYNDAESNMLSSFNNLAMYFAHHPTS